MPQKLLRAFAASAVLAVAAAIAGAVPAAHPVAADAARPASRPGAGDVAIARQRLNVVAGRRAMVAGRVVAAAGHGVALERRSGAGWRTIDRARTATGGRFAFRF